MTIRHESGNRIRTKDKGVDIFYAYWMERKGKEKRNEWCIFHQSLWNCCCLLLLLVSITTTVVMKTTVMLLMLMNEMTRSTIIYGQRIMSSSRQISSLWFKGFTEETFRNYVKSIHESIFIRRLMHKFITFQHFHKSSTVQIQSM